MESPSKYKKNSISNLKSYEIIIALYTEFELFFFSLRRISIITNSFTQKFFFCEITSDKLAMTHTPPRIY